MLSIPGVAVQTLLYESVNSLIYRAVREADNQPIILKLLKDSYPTPQELVRYRTEYRITRALKEAGVVQVYDLQKHQNTLVMFLEDFGGESLKILMQQRKFSLKEFLQIAIATTETLGQIHVANIIHKDINPSNIVYNPETEQLKIIDFGISTQLSRETPTLKNPGILEGTLAYISPEQTGRMNRTLDYRADFYSLGVTFYELLTGKLPFETEDALELVHCHIARQPVTPQEIEPKIPLIISQIVIKLMAKNAENRYQTALGLKHDLENCLVQLQATGNIEKFALGKRDITDRFSIPEKLYGRENEVSNLLAAFERVASGRSPQPPLLRGASSDSPLSRGGGWCVPALGEEANLSSSELMLVAGFSGIGKTALVNEVHKPIARQQGYFIKGKYDQFQRNIPFSAFVQAFRDLMGQLLSESDAKLQIWKTKIFTAVGNNGQVLIEVIPELERILGAQHPAIELSGSAAQNRFNLLMQNFVQVFTTAEHPLVIFLDDLQWADSASLKLLQLLMEDRGHLLVLGAYRDNEVSPTHPFMLTVDEIIKSGAVVHTIILQPLSLADLNQLVADTLICDLSLAQPLTELVAQKTQGNPFFSTQFLKALHDDGLITFDPPQSPLSKGGSKGESPLSKGGSKGESPLSKGGSKGESPLSQGGSTGDSPLSKGGSTGDSPLSQGGSTGDSPLSQGGSTGDSPLTKGGSKGHWQCDIAQARLTHASDVVEFMATQLQKLPQETQDVLKLAACIGAQFDLDTLAVVSEELPEKTASALWKALEEELILPIHENYKCFIPTEAQFKTDSISNPTYRFLHDRVQQAAYSLIPDRQKPATHLKVGQLLLQSSSESEREEKLFDIVEHLNLGQESIAQANERDALAQLNLKAGQKARNSTAYAAAKVYLQIGINLLTANCWESQYELTLNLYVAAVEVAYLNADFDDMDQIAAEVLEKAQTILDKVKTYEILINAQTAQSQTLKAIAVAREALAQLGVELPTEPDQVKIDQALQSLARKLQDRSIEELVNLPVMSDIETQAAMQLLGMLFSPISQTMPSLMPLLSSTMVSLSLQFGNTPASTLGYLIHGVVLCNFLGDVKTGYRFGKLALNLLDRFNATEFKSQILAVFSSWIQHHQEALRARIPISKDGYIAGMETGDFLYASYSILVYFEGNLCGGVEIDTWEAELEIYSAAFAQIKQYSAQIILDITWQTTKNLRETVSTPDCLIGQAYNETVMIPKHHQDNNFTMIAIVYTYKLMLAYFFGNYPAALSYIAQIKPYLMSVSGLIFFPIFHFYAALTHLALFPTHPEIEQAEILALVENHQITLHQWAQNAPMNHLHKWYLVEAEKQRIFGNKAEAIDLYDRAISLAQENQFLNEEALANELAAKFYLEWGKEKFAQIYMIDAYYGYVQWGATAKVKDLETRYPQLLKAIQAGTKNTKNTALLTTTGSGNHVDITAVMKASQAISGEILLDQLLSSLMKILIENAGAQRGYLILSSQEQLLIEAEGTIDDNRVTVLQSILVEDCQELASAIVNYVARTQESVVLDDAVREGQFINDSYIQKHQPKSILCVPLINQSQIVSIVYLENNLTAGAFTPERVELLKVLSGQAAISIQNSKLYTEVRESEKRLAQLNKAYERFVPSQFLKFLDKSSIIDVELGDQVQLEMSVLFSDIRDFTTLSESMTPEDNFRFINSYLSRMEPVINQNNGFIDKYIGDAIMALFSGDANNAVNAGIAMLNRLFEYNQNRANSGYAPIQIGIGINTGSLMLGTVGGPNRMDGTVISDAVNLASRVEGLTKNYGVSLLITQETYSRLENPSKYAIRSLDTVKVKGKSEAVTVYEVFDCDRPEIKEGKLATLELFAEALAIYSEGKFAEAGRLFAECWDQNQGDRVAKIYWERCQST